VLVTQEMGILNVQHHCNTGCKAVMSLDGWAVEKEAVQGSVWVHGDFGEHFLNPYKLLTYYLAYAKLIICKRY
jgi:hypothetical protein